MRDSNALAWRLHSILRGVSPVETLDSFQQDRAEIAQMVVRGSCMMGRIGDKHRAAGTVPGREDLLLMGRVTLAALDNIVKRFKEQRPNDRLAGRMLPQLTRKRGTPAVQYSDDAIFCGGAKTALGVLVVIGPERATTALSPKAQALLTRLSGVFAVLNLQEWDDCPAKPELKDRSAILVTADRTVLASLGVDAAASTRQAWADELVGLFAAELRAVPAAV